MQPQAIMTVVDLMTKLEQLAFTQEPNLGKDAGWVPESPAGKALFARLTAAANRRALKEWYARFRDVELNPCALNLKASLERAINEPLA
jgi:hypothetical protein